MRSSISTRRPQDEALLSDDELALSRARAAIARDDDRAMEILTPLLASAEIVVSVRSAILAGLFAIRRDDREAARAHLSRVHLRWPAERPDLALELARTWSKVDEKRARKVYRDLIRELQAHEEETSPDAERRHAAALARYRLGQLVVAENAERALELWKAAVNARETLVSPYAAHALASLIGERLLLPERVEELYQHAIHSGHPALCSRAAINVSDQLERRLQFDEALAYLKVAVDRGDPSYVARVEEKIASLEDRQRYAPTMRHLRESTRRMQRVRKVGQLDGTEERLIIIGAGRGGQYLLEALLASREKPVVCGFIDDAAAEVAGHPEYWVLGRIEDLSAVIHREKPTRVLIAIPTLRGAKRRKVVNDCWDANVEVRDLTSPHRRRLGWTIKDDAQSLSDQLRPVHIDALIGTRDRAVNLDAISWEAKPRPLVIGVGALGMEICRALARGQAQGLMMLDRDPTALHRAEEEVRHTVDAPEGYVTPMYNDVGYDGVADAALDDYKPSIVFYTAGSRETEPSGLGLVQAARSDVLTVARVAEAAESNGVERFVFVSKTGGSSYELNALNVLAEAAVLTRATGRTSCVVVRSGPLLESRTSVISEIQAQIDRGTSIRIPSSFGCERYLSATAAAELILLAARGTKETNALAERSYHYELVGETVSLDEVAHDLVRLAGLRPGVDITIDVGDPPARPLVTPSGDVHPEDDRLIRLPAAPCSLQGIDDLCDELQQLVADADEVGVRKFARNVEDRLAEVCEVRPVGIS